MMTALGIALVLLVVVGSIALFGASGAEAADQTVHIGTFSVAIDYAPILVAKSKGWMDEALATDGLKPEYTTFQSLPPINEALATKRMDIMFEAEPPALIGQASGIDLRIVDVGAVVTLKILVPTDSPVTDAAGLKGKKIAVLAGTSADFNLRKSLAAAGLKEDDYTLVDLAPPEAQAAFKAKDVDAWAVWPPFVEQAELGGYGRILPSADTYIYSLMIAREGFIKDHPAAFAHIAATIARAKIWISENAEEAQKLVAEQFNLPLPVVQKAWPLHRWTVPLDASAVGDIQTVADFLYGHGMIRHKVDVASQMLVEKP